ncbi:helix-turn-helix domain-containing protein [Entomobacter blattae]|uniref:Helix-turn-helix protein n=1 Tax=Entomobacter blattae TaxID=2762277 RepID=A0A7H1NUI9_9PROT|nr:helix-turn-helix transcriptional regulator [Entomobacter blattae]QNT79449.1 helix-turn-helix protein [Entomobacter blattae]
MSASLNTISPKILAQTQDTVTISKDDLRLMQGLIEEMEDERATFLYEMEKKAALQSPHGEMLTYTATEVDQMLDEGVHPLAIWRKRRKLTQQKLAEQSGISLSYIAEIETHVKTGSVRVLLKLAKALDVPIEALIEEE